MRSEPQFRFPALAFMSCSKLLAIAVLASFTVSCGPNGSPSPAPDNGEQTPDTSSGDESRVDSKVIYGDDNRRDYFEESDPALRQLADSTVALMDRGDLTAQGGKILIKGSNFGTSYQLCTSEPYRDQTSAAFCSGFLVAPDKMVTAGHCITSAQECADTVFVFGFAYRSAGIAPSEVNASEVYGCQKVIHSQAPGYGADYAVIQLDRPVVGHQPLALRRSGQIKVGDELVVMGHPSGIPLKIADGAKVRSTNAAGYFTANLDTFGGNSGSAVFNSRTLEVEGILVRGAQDYKWTTNQCYVSYRCADNSCRGEDVTNIAETLPHLATQSRPVRPVRPVRPRR